MATGESKQRIAVLDLGSTSFHMLVADATPQGDIQRVDRQREMLRLGATINESGEIPESVCDAAVGTATQMCEEAKRLGADPIVAIATAALRDARNGLHIAQRIGDALGEPVRLLSGEEEARLIFAAFAQRVALDDEIALGIDLGGGSCELATGNRWSVTWETTLRVGVTRLHRALVDSDPMGADHVRAIRDEVETAIARHHATVLSQGATRFIASGGTVRALARLVERGEGPRSECGTRSMLAEELRSLTQRLVASSHDHRLAMPGIKRSRADLLPTGAVILDTISDLLEVDELVVCDWGLREGAVLEALGLVDTR